MTQSFNNRLSARAASAGVTIDTGAKAQLEAYVRLLTVWNEKINLTALPLKPLSDETIDRLLIEPICAARFVGGAPQAWFDVGSGGGSPAIPFKIVHASAKLTMVESTAKKTAFLREAIRVLELSEATVRNERFESVSHPLNALDLVTVRAVRSDPVLFRTLHRLLAPTGRAFLFHSSRAEPDVPASAFSTVEVVPLGRAGNVKLTILKPMFHVEQTR